MLGYAPGEFSASSGTFFDYLHPDDAATLAQVLPPVLKGEVPRLLLDHRLRHKDGHWVCLSARGQVTRRNAHGWALRMAGTDVDRTEQKQAEVALRVAAVAFASSSAMMVSDAQQVILRVNQAFVELTGYTASETVGLHSSVLKSGRHDAAFYQAMWACISETGHWEGELWNRRKNGEVFLDWLSVTVVKDTQGVVTHYVSVHTDITLRKRTEEDIRKLAFFDPLTQLPNRRLLLDRLQQLIAAHARSSQTAAVLFIDLDRFKQLNDTYGHDQGDDLLVQVAHRLQACVREIDTVARLGGDEFVVALAQLGDNEPQARVAAVAVAQKILMTLSEPFFLPVTTWQLSASIGLVMLLDAKTPPEDLLKQADEAMYQAKAAGRNAVRVWRSKFQ
jgi:diguanylate cyclase (GGDEF)-like protein/PAS domain S-box-containing protein